MGVSSSSSGTPGEGDDDAQRRGAEDPTRPLVAAASSDRCARCGSQLASDQRYCLSCGERRGRARFPVADMAAVSTTRRETVVSSPAPTGPRMTSGTTLIAGILTLLLAMGVGVLIGREGTQLPRTNASAPVQVVTVGGGGGGGATGAVASGGPTTTSAPHITKGTLTASQGKGKPPIFKKVVITKQVLQHANSSLGQVVPTDNLAPPTVTATGQACSGGAGCQNGKFTGNFFGQ